MATQTKDPTHQAVQDYYGKIARQTGSCCGSSASSQASSCCGQASQPAKIQNDLYPEDLLAGLPEEVANFTNGSGDPISLADLKPGETVLDLGSGGGLDCFLAARLVGEKGHVIGVDMTPEMLNRARASAEKMNVRNVEFREGILESLPVDDSSVDVILSNCVINLSPDKPLVLREMFRVLKPGGRIAISDTVANHPLSTLPEKDRESWCACTSGALERGQYSEELSRAGFADIRLEPDVEVAVKAVESGVVEAPENTTQEQVLEEIDKWDRSSRTMVVPHKITARKPA